MSRMKGYIKQNELGDRPIRGELSTSQQSRTVAAGVDRSFESKQGNDKESNEIGAGDQSVVYGFACDETEEMLPLPIVLAHKLAKRLEFVRKADILPYLRPDGKSLVVINYEFGEPRIASSLLISAQHNEGISDKRLRNDIVKNVIFPIIPSSMIDESTKIFVNPSGPWHLGGSAADTGLTGRKLAVDTYGGIVPFGGGSLSGKDPTKIDRTGAYYARYIAKNIVAAGLAKRVGVQISYGIGIAKPLGMTIYTHGTETVDREIIFGVVADTFNPRPGSVIKELDLYRPIYFPTACYGHFGRADMPWENTDISKKMISLVS